MLYIHVPLADCRGQGYDNGFNISGSYKGEKPKPVSYRRFLWQSFAPVLATVSLNLCGVSAAECCPEVIIFFGIIQRLYTLFSCSPQRWEILQKHMGCSLHGMSTTRWCARIESVSAHASSSYIECLRKTKPITAEIRSEIHGI